MSAPFYRILTPFQHLAHHLASADAKIPVYTGGMIRTRYMSVYTVDGFLVPDIAAVIQSTGAPSARPSAPLYGLYIIVCMDCIWAVYGLYMDCTWIYMGCIYCIRTCMHLYGMYTHGI